MDEIVDVVVKKTGLSEEQAHSAVEAVFDYLKKKLPEGIGSHLDDLAGSNQEGGVLGQVAKVVGGLLHKQEAN